MKRSTQVALVGVLMLAVASLAAAQGTLQVPSGTPQPAMRFGNFIEIGNDVLMHIIATNQFNYSGSWGSDSTSCPTCFNSDNHYSNTSGNTYQVSFNGTQIKLYTSRGSIAESKKIDHVVF